LPPHLHLDLTEPHRHLVRATLRWTPRGRSCLVRLPAWTPGSYLIRDYVRTLEGLAGRQGGEALAIERLEPACWRVSTPSAEPVELHWRILATDLSVRTCQLNADHGFLCLAGVALQLEGERWTPHRLSLRLPEGWQPFLSLPHDQGTWLAPDFDTLIDSPIEAGPHPVHAFTVAGVPHRWVSWGADLPSQDPGWLGDVERVALACCRLLGEERPAAGRYLFVLHLLEKGYGGLEHDEGCVLQYSRAALLEPQGRRRLLQLVAHEYLHQWNVRRLRPVELTPIDYDRAVPVPSLWFAEGITSYVDQLLPLMAGLSTEPELLQDLGQDLSRYRLTPGRQVQSLRDSSEEAWVKLYRADAYSGDSQVSYYLKGAVLALCLDLHLRVAGGCLAHVLQALWRSHGRWGRGYSERDLVAAFAVVAPDLEDLLPRWLRCVDDPDLDGYLRTVGLSLQAMPTTNAWTGLTAGTDSGQLLARRVQRGGPAEAAGVMVGDELVALDGARLREPEQFERSARAGAQQELLISRRSRLQRLQLQPLAPQPQAWSLVADPEASAEALARRRAWLSLVELG